MLFDLALSNVQMSMQIEIVLVAYDVLVLVVVLLVVQFVLVVGHWSHASCLFVH
jgi:hypothetical protein